jgi:hypothetical protein
VAAAVGVVGAAAAAMLLGAGGQRAPRGAEALAESLGSMRAHDAVHVAGRAWGSVGPVDDGRTLCWGVRLPAGDTDSECHHDAEVARHGGVVGVALQRLEGRAWDVAIVSGFAPPGMTDASVILSDCRVLRRSVGRHGAVLAVVPPRLIHAGIIPVAVELAGGGAPSVRLALIRLRDYAGKPYPVRSCR